MSLSPIKNLWSATKRPRAIYVHVPFCKAKCRYCDFYSLANESDRAEDFVNAIATELAMHCGHIKIPADSIFIGGGTPTALGPKLLGKLIDTLTPFANEATEFSVEANPCTIDPEIANLFGSSPVNRVSVGAQSFDADELKSLGRLHGPDQIVRSIDLIRSAGVDNLSIDLMFGIPGQDLASWEATLDKALELEIKHLSCYALSFEESTPLWEDLRQGRVEPMDDSAQRDCYFTAIAKAKQAGLGHYEISNFAMSGFKCKHNLVYWHNEPYLGLGPGAASFFPPIRSKNKSNLTGYLSAIDAQRRPPSNREQVSFRKSMAETLMLSLRLTAGVRRSSFADRFGIDALEAFCQSLGRHAESGSLLITDESIRIVPESMFVADTILADLLGEA